MTLQREDLDPVHVEINNNTSGLGDTICSLPVYRWALDCRPKWPAVKYHVRTFFPELFEHVFGSRPNLVVRPWTELRGGKFNRIAFPPSPTSMRFNTVDYLFATLMDTSVSIEFKNYPSADFQKLEHLLPRFESVTAKPFALVSLGHTTATKRLPDSTLLALSMHLKYLGILPVFVGRNYDIGPNSSLRSAITTKLRLEDYGINLVDKTSTMEMLALIGKAKVVIGIDGGLIHLAGMHPTIPIVPAYTIVRPEHKMPIRNNIVGWNCFPVVPSPKLKCRFCQDTLHDVPGFNGAVCHFEDYACLPRGDAFIEKIDAALGAT